MLHKGPGVSFSHASIVSALAKLESNSLYLHAYLANKADFD